MAIINKSQLRDESNQTYISNNNGAITPENVRTFNNDLIDSLALQTDLDSVSASLSGVSSSFNVVSASVATLNAIEFISASQTASMVVASASYTEYAVTASYALNGGSGGSVDTASLVSTASFGTYTASQAAKGYATTGSNVFDGHDNIFNNNIVVLGTASINYIHSNIQSQSIIFSSGSNILGDEATDVQRLVGIVQITGSLTATGVSKLTGIFSGSFDGTGSYATTASYSLSGSYSDTASYIDLSNDTLSIGNKTGILKGGEISLGAGNTFNVSSGSAQVISQSYEGPNYIKTSKVVVTWPTRTNVEPDYKNTHPVSYIYIDRLGNVEQQTGSFSNEDFRTKIVLGAVTHADNEYIDSITDLKVTAFNSYKADEGANIYGPLKTSGLELETIFLSNKLSVQSGSVYYNGGNFGTDPWNANTQNVPRIATASLTRIWQSGSGYQLDNNANVFGPQFYTDIDPDHFVNLTTGQLVTASTGYFTTQRIYQHYDNPDKLFVYYGSQEYPAIDQAVSAIAFEKFVESDATKNGVFLGYVVIKQGTSNLADPLNGVIIYAGIGRHIFLSTGTNIGAFQAPLTAITFAYPVPATTWSLNHQLQVDYPIVQAYSSESKEVIIPNKIVSVNSSQTDLYFDYAFAGSVTVAAAGAQIVQGAFYGFSSASFYEWTGSSTSEIQGTASYAHTASYLIGGTVSASWASSSLSSSVAAKAFTASYFSGSFGIVDTLVVNTLSASVLYAQSSSIAYTSGSNKFGNSVGNIQELTGSVGITGSLTLDNSTRALIPNLTGSLNGSASYAFNSATASVLTGTASQAISSSYAVSSSQSATASYSHTASYVKNSLSASLLTSTASQAYTASFLQNAQFATASLSGSYAQTASYVNIAITASRITGSGVIGAVGNSFTASYITGSNVAGIVSQSYTASLAFTSSYVKTAQTASAVNVLNQNVRISTQNGTAALVISGSSTEGGTDYLDIIKATNTTAGATNPNKSVRVSKEGSLEVINSAYSSTIFSLSDLGHLSTPAITSSLYGTAATASFASQINDKGSSGYTDIGSIRIQWGIVNGTSQGTGSAIFPAPFANSNYNLTQTIAGSYTSGVFSIISNIRTTTGYTWIARVINNGGTLVNAGEAHHYIAIGLKP